MSEKDLSHPPIFYRLVNTMQTLYCVSIKQCRPDLLKSINGPTYHGKAAIAIAATIWESFVNFFLRHPSAAAMYFGKDVGAKVENLPAKVEKMSIEQKTIDLPMLLFGRTFTKEEKRFQDFQNLVRIRNAIIHSRHVKKPTEAIESLREAGIFLPTDNHPAMKRSWDQELETLEVIRWSMNTVSAMTMFIAQECRPGMQCCISHFPAEMAQALIDEHTANYSAWDVDEQLQRASQKCKKPEK